MPERGKPKDYILMVERDFWGHHQGPPPVPTAVHRIASTTHQNEQAYATTTIKKNKNRKVISSFWISEGYMPPQYRAPAKTARPLTHYYWRRLLRIAGGMSYYYSARTMHLMSEASSSSSLHHDMTAAGEVLPLLVIPFIIL